jgi:hypothetical protein
MPMPRPHTKASSHRRASCGSIRRRALAMIQCFIDVNPLQLAVVMKSAAHLLPRKEPLRPETGGETAKCPETYSLLPHSPRIRPHTSSGPPTLTRSAAYRRYTCHPTSSRCRDGSDRPEPTCPMYCTRQFRPVQEDYFRTPASRSSIIPITINSCAACHPERSEAQGRIWAAQGRNPSFVGQILRLRLRMTESNRQEVFLIRITDHHALHSRYSRKYSDCYDL